MCGRRRLAGASIRVASNGTPPRAAGGRNRGRAAEDGGTFSFDACHRGRKLNGHARCHCCSRRGSLRRVERAGGRCVGRDERENGESASSRDGWRRRALETTSGAAERTIAATERSVLAALDYLDAVMELQGAMAETLSATLSRRSGMASKCRERRAGRAGPSGGGGWSPPQQRCWHRRRWWWQ